MDSIDENIAPYESADNEDFESRSEPAAKKLLIIYILEVLMKYSNENNKLTQSQIISHIKNDYDMECERKAVSRNIKALVDHGMQIGTYEENKEGYYLKDRQLSPEDAFDAWEALMSSKYFSTSGPLANKVAELSGEKGGYFQGGWGGVTDSYTYPKDLIRPLLISLMEAINFNRRIRFNYNAYSRDKTFAPVEGSPFTASPYAVLNVDNEYYLAAKGVFQKALSCYKVAMISDIELLNVPREDIAEASGYSKGFDAEKFVREHIPGFRGDDAFFTVKIKPERIGEAIDRFGEEFKIIGEEEGALVIEVHSNSEKLFNWAVLTAQFTEVIEPVAMRLKLKEYLDAGSWKYR